MKRIITLFVYLFTMGMCLQTVQAQQITVGGSASKSALSKTTGNQSMSVVDTLMPPILTSGNSCADSIYYYTYNGGLGYVTGNNKLGSGAYLSREVAQRYNFSGTGAISDVLVNYAKKAGSNAITYAKVLNVSGTTHAPTTKIDSSANTITTGLITLNSFTDYFFSPSVSVTSTFAVSAVFPNPANGDTTVVWETKLTCHSVDSLSSIHYYGPTGTDLGWVLYTQWLNAARTNPNDTSLDLYIFPVIDITSGINDPPTSKGLSLLGAYPNPAKSFTTISYRVSASAQATINVFDLSGKIYKTSTEGVHAGDHQFQLNVSDMAAGNYFYTIKTEEAIMTSKFTVVK